MLKKTRSRHHCHRLCNNMTLEVYQDEEVDPPERVRRVSFAAGIRAPLTPHSKNVVARNKTPKSGTKNQPKSQTTSSSTIMENGKENHQPSGVTSLRRQLRATMSPPPPSNSNKENSASQQQQSRQATTTSALTPSFRHNTRESSKKPLKTPKSLLKRELAFNDAEESLLISPGGDLSFSLANDDAVETSRPQPQQLKSPFETVHEENSDENHEVEEEQSPTVVVQAANVPPVLVEHVEPKVNDHDTAKPLKTTGRAQHRAMLKQQRAQQPTTETIRETGTTPYRTRGNGVQMDLSSMFTEMASPEVQQEKSQQVLSNVNAVEQKEEPSVSNVPVASLGNLRESLWLDFGDERKNQVGTTRTLSFAIEVPVGDDCVAEVERVPFKKGFDLIVDQGSTGAAQVSSEPKPTTIRLVGGERVLLKVSWTPVETGGVREVIYLKLPRGRLCVIVHGKARTPKSAKAGKVRKVSLESKYVVSCIADCRPAKHTSC